MVQFSQSEHPDLDFTLLTAKNALAASRGRGLSDSVLLFDSEDSFARNGRYMTPDDHFDVPFQVDDETQQQDNANQSEIDPPQAATEEAADADGELAELAEPFVGQWNQLISTTNWEKGRIIGQWRESLMESGADPQHYSDEAWSRRVGGVTAPHVGRLRRVFDRFGSTYETYAGLYWSHFLAALDWDDAPMWLEGASQEKWSVSRMREQRWQAEGAVESNRPASGEIIEVDTDEDVVMPAQGGGRTKEYGDEPGVASGPRHEDPDFGDEEELMSLSGGESSPATGTTSAEPESGPVQPFAGLPELPDDLADAIETLKLAVLRHKTSGWESTDADTVQKYLDAVGVLLRS